MLGGDLFLALVGEVVRGASLAGFSRIFAPSVPDCHLSCPAVTCPAVHIPSCPAVTCPRSECPQCPVCPTCAPVPHLEFCLPLMWVLILLVLAGLIGLCVGFSAAQTCGRRRQVVHRKETAVTDDRVLFNVRALDW